VVNGWRLPKRLLVSGLQEQELEQEQKQDHEHLDSSRGFPVVVKMSLSLLGMLDWMGPPVMELHVRVRIKETSRRFLAKTNVYACVHARTLVLE
jgi:hypothetical protein